MVLKESLASYKHSDVSNINNYSGQSYVISGCGVTENTPADMDVVVAGGYVVLNGTKVTVAGGNVTTTTATAGKYKYGIIRVNASGTLSVVYGTEDVSDDVPPNGALNVPDYEPDNYVALARVKIGDVSSITNSDIFDLRTINTNYSDIETLETETEGIMDKADYSLIKALIYQDKQGDLINQEDGIFIDGMVSDRNYTNSNFTYDATNDYWYSSSATAQLTSDAIPDATSGNELFTYLDYEVKILNYSFDATLSEYYTTSTSGGTATQTGGELQLNAPNSGSTSASGTSDGSTYPFDVKGLSSEKIQIYCNINAVYARAGYSYARIQLGGITIWDSGEVTNQTYELMLEVDIKNEKARYNNLTTDTIGEWVDCSAWGATVYLTFAVGSSSHAGNPGQIHVADVYYISENDTSSTITIESTCDGSNWEIVNNKERATLSNSGSTKQARINFTKSGDEIIIVKGIGLRE